MTIRTATIDDLNQVTELEATCFPPAEAATRRQIADRLIAYGNHFLLMLNDEGRVISMVNGPVTQEADLSDEMYADSAFHDETGDWQMIFGVDTLPEYQRKGYAGQLITAFCQAAREAGKKGVVLTCKDHKIAYYSKFGFVNEGESQSVHGGVIWYQMRLTF